jgi:TnpA family transposase
LIKIKKYIYLHPFTHQSTIIHALLKKKNSSSTHNWLNKIIKEGKKGKIPAKTKERKEERRD